MPLTSLFRPNRRHAAVMAAYHRIVEQSREPWFFAGWDVPDTVAGRFEVLALHAFLVLNRLKSTAAPASAFAQELFDTMFADLDRGLREMGATDIGVGRHVKAMARGLYGRIVAYEQGLAQGDEVLAQALVRNLFATQSPMARAPERAAAAAAYVRHQVAVLAAAPTDTLLSGEIPFAPVAEG